MGPSLIALIRASPQDIRSAVRDIVGRPEFREPKRDWLAKLGNALLDPINYLVRLIDWVLSRTGHHALTVGAWVVAVAIVSVVVLLATRFGRSVGTDKVLPLGTLDGPTAVLSAREFLVAAEQFERSGDWRNAIHCRYGALVAELEGNGVVDRLPGKTTGEYLRQVSDNVPGAGDAFGRATSLFEWVWYGDLPVAQSDLEQFKQFAQSVRKVRRRVAA